MALELMPDGTFKKLSKVQTDALDRYYKRENGDILSSLIGSPILPSLIYGTLGVATLVTAWAYLKDQDLPSFDESANWLGGGVGGVIAKAYTNNPKSPQFIPSIDPLKKGEMVEVPRCKRWEIDAAALIETTKLSAFFELPLLAPQFTILRATKSVHIIKNMKREGCPKPDAFSQAQWDDVTI
jgi:hypothetical protein